MGYDVLIKNGLIIDGTGREPFKGNLAITGGQIAGLGDVNGSATKVIDADGSAVTPGFWDLHTHYDALILNHLDLSLCVA